MSTFNNQIESNFLTTEQLAAVYGYVNKYFNTVYGFDIIDVLEFFREEPVLGDPVENIMCLIFDGFGNKINVSLLNKLHKEISNISKNANISVEEIWNIFAKSLYELSEKQILRVSDDELKMSRMSSLSIATFKDDKIVRARAKFETNDAIKMLKSNITEEQLKRIIDLLKINMAKYEQLYKGKIWLIESDISLDTRSQILRKKEQILIPPEKFFHLMGFDYKCFIDDTGQFGDRRANLHMLKKLCSTKKDPHGHDVEKLLESYEKERLIIEHLGNKAKFEAVTLKGEQLYILLELIIQNEQRLLEMLGDGKLSGIASVPKLMMKGYAFERMGIITDASGMVVFDKNIALQRGIDDIRNGNAVYLLNDIIRNNNLSFIFSQFQNQYGINAKNASSLFVSQEDKFNSSYFNGQTASVSHKVAAYRPSDFNFKITEVNSSSEEGTYESPIYEFSFSNAQKYRILTSMIKAFPNMKNIKEMEEYAKELGEAVTMGDLTLDGNRGKRK